MSAKKAKAIASQQPADASPAQRHHEGATEADTPLAATALSLGTVGTLPFSVLKLVDSYNARTQRNPEYVQTLANDILRNGLIHNLSVTPIPRPKGSRSKEQFYAVVAGGYRYAALASLVEAGNLEADASIGINVVAPDAALSVSLRENIYREPMDAVEQYEAFWRMVEEGKSVEDVASEFLISPLVVRRRLQLAKVHPTILAAFRNKEMDLDRLMAYASSDDQTRQLEVFKSRLWNIPQIKQHLHGEEVNATDNAMALLVGAEAFAAAGGVIRKDLFAEPDAAGHWSPEHLLISLAQGKLSAKIAKVKAEGWAWVKFEPRIDSFSSYDYIKTPVTAQFSVKQQAEVDRLNAERDPVVTRIQELEAEDAEDSDEYAALEKQEQALSSAVGKIANTATSFHPDAIPLSGAVVGLDARGVPTTKRGFMTKEDYRELRRLLEQQDKAARRAAGAGSGDESDVLADADEAGPSKIYPKGTWQSLTKSRTAALQATVASNPRVALALAVATLAPKLVDDDMRYYDSGPAKLSGSSHVMIRMKDDTDTDIGEVRVKEIRAHWRAQLQEVKGPLFAAMLEWPEDKLLALLAYCVGATIEEVNESGAVSDESKAIARAVGLDMHNWWTPGRAFFAPLSKTTLLPIISRFAPAQAKAVAKGKKDPIVDAALQIAAAHAWLPPIFEGAEQSASASSERPGADAPEAGAPPEPDEAEGDDSGSESEDCNNALAEVATDSDADDDLGTAAEG